MSFSNWEGFQTLAKALVKFDNHEDLMRSAINRSYYFAFNISVSYAEEHLAFERSGRNIHERILDNMKDYGNREVKEAGRKLHRLQKKRVDADYRGLIKIKKSDAKESIILADEIMGTIKSQINSNIVP